MRVMTRVVTATVVGLGLGVVTTVAILGTVPIPRKTVSEFPGTKYVVEGVEVIEFNGVHGDRCVKVEAALTCDWRSRE